MGNGKDKKSASDKLLEKLHPLVPRPEFRLMCIGPSGYGKSMFAKWLLIEHYAKQPIFDHIIMFCPTIENDKTLKDLVNFKNPKESSLDTDLVFTSTDKNDVNETIQALWDKFSYDEIKASEKNEPFHVLFIFDDVGGEFGRSKEVQKLFTKGRKINASIIVMANAYNTYDPTCRNNSTHLAIFKPGAGRERDIIINDIQDSRGKKEMEKIFEKVFDSRNFEVGDFIFVDKQNLGNPEYLRKNLDTFI